MKTGVRKLITPAMAQELLKKNKDNRPVNKDHVDYLAEQMKQGKWKYTGESIKLSTKDRLLDGQHRLLAVIQSNTTIEVLFIDDLDENIFACLDTGRNRKASDILAIEGVDHSAKIAAMTRFILGFKKEKYGDTANYGANGKNKITNMEVLTFYKRNKENINRSYKFGFDRNNKIVPPAMLAGMHYIFSEKDEQHATYFCDRLKDGIGLSAEHAILKLRERLINSLTTRAKISATERLALIVKAWCFFRANKHVQGSLRWQKGVEDFPKII